MAITLPSPTQNCDNWKKKWSYVYEKGLGLVGITNLDKSLENLAYGHRHNTLACTRLPVYLLLSSCYCFFLFFFFFLATYSLMSKTNVTCVLYQILETHPIQFDQLNVFLYFTVIKFTASFYVKIFVLGKSKSHWYYLYQNSCIAIDTERLVVAVPFSWKFQLSPLIYDQWVWWPEVNKLDQSLTPLPHPSVSLYLSNSTTKYLWTCPLQPFAGGGYRLGAAPEEESAYVAGERRRHSGQDVSVCFP